MDRSSSESTRGLGPLFRAVLAASAVSNIGDGLRLSALPLLAASLTSSPLVIGGLTAAQFLPWTTFAPFGGVIVDRSDRRKLIMVTQAWRAALMTVFAGVVLLGQGAMWQLFAVAFLITVGEILVDPSVVATVPTLVPPQDLDRANGRLTTVETVTNDFLGGPVGAATFAVAPWLPFMIDGGSYLASIVPFSRLPSSRTSEGRSQHEGSAATASPVSPDSRASPAPSVWSEMGEGIGWIRRHSFLGPVTIGVAIFHLGTSGSFSLLILVVTDVLGAPEIVFGSALAASAAGATVASLLAARLATRFSRRSVVTGAALLTAVSVLGVAGSRSGAELIGAWGLNGAAGGVLLTIGRGFVQRHTPNELLGRAAIASRMITRTSFVLGALVAGVVASWTSIRWSFVAAAGFHLLGALLISRSFRHEPSN